MKLRQAALVTLVGMSLSFALRTIGTLFPAMPVSLYFACFSVLIHFLAAFLLLRFFIIIYGLFSGLGDKRLKRSALLAVIGSSAALLLHIKAIMIVYHIAAVPLYLQYRLLDALVPFFASAAVWVFFVIFSRAVPPGKGSRLKTGTRSAVSGYFIFTLLHGAGFFNYLLFDNFKWIFQWGLWVLVLTAIGFSMILYFFFVCYQNTEDLIEVFSGDRSAARPASGTRQKPSV